MSIKYKTVGYLSKCFCQCASWLLRRDFEDSCDKVTFRMPLSKKITITVMEVFLFQVLLPLVLNKNNKHAEYHVIFIPFKGQIYSKYGSHVSLLFGKWTLVIFSHVWVEPKFLLFAVTWQTSSTFNVCMKTLNELCIANVCKNVIAVPYFFIKTFHL